MAAHLTKQELLDALYRPYRKCQECPLGTLGRNKVVFGEGNVDAELFLIGEAPGRREDLEGRPFIGQSGLFLDTALAKVGIERNSLFITSIVKCRPPNNRVPLPLEISTCTSLFLYNQIKIIKPRIICALGSVALNTLMSAKLSITKVRGTPLEYKDGILLIPTYHPAYLLRNRSKLNDSLADLALIRTYLSKTD
ncbi:uracil-DNA glycosylase [Candidatus Dependentiae bacterium]|nr:uracil-DNA glycosylase [Candidatus Dependentiae bacterium]